jgi:RNA polymerase sigma-70 factor (ECF subfamily)
MLNPVVDFTHTKRYRTMATLGIAPNTMIPAMDDDTFVARARRGDSHAFRELWSRHHRKLFHVAFKILRNREDAEDVIQDSFLKAYTHLDGFDGRSQFSTWLTRIVINGALQVLRKKRFVGISIDCGFGDEEGSWDLPDRSPDAEANYLKTELDERLRAAIRSLPRTLRCVVELRLSHEGPLSEIAESAGISLPATKSRLLRARRNLRQSIQSAD